jgi:hypothetical protein
MEHFFVVLWMLTLSCDPNKNLSAYVYYYNYVELLTIYNNKSGIIYKCPICYTIIIVIICVTYKK